MKSQITRRWTIMLAALLAIAIGVPASTLALPSDAPNLEVNAPRRADAPSVSSIWDQPAEPSPVVVVRPPEPPPAAPEHAPSANPLWEIPLTSLSNTRERPIFSSSRRPPPPAIVSVSAARTAPPPPKPLRAERPELALVGTIAGDEQSFGLFVDLKTKSGVRLKIGEDFQGWKLQSVQGREVTLERDQQSATLTLPQPGTGAPGPALPRRRDESAAAQRPVDPPAATR